MTKLQVRMEINVVNFVLFIYQYKVAFVVYVAYDNLESTKPLIQS